MHIFFFFWESQTIFWGSEVLILEFWKTLRDADMSNFGSKKYTREMKQSLSNDNF